MSVFPFWLERIPEPILFGGVLLVAMVGATLVALPIVWFNNWRRLVPERIGALNYLKAFGAFSIISIAIAIGAAAGVFLLRPLERFGPAVAAIPGSVIVVVALMAIAARHIRRTGG